MTKNRIKYLLDFIPLIILIVSAIISIYTVETTDQNFLWEHIVGLTVLPINIGLFLWRHKIAVLALGITLVLGFFTVLSYDIPFTVQRFAFAEIPLYYGQSIFLLWLLIYFVVSWRHFTDIDLKEYWQNLDQKQEYK